MAINPVIFFDTDGDMDAAAMGAYGDGGSHFALQLVQDSAQECITVAEAKAQARILTSAEDALVSRYITTARNILECYMNRAIINQRWRMILDGTPRGDSLRLKVSSLVSVQSIISFALDNSLNTMATTDYFVDTYATPGRVCLNYGKIWPPVVRPRSSFVVDFTAGFSSTPADVPAAVRQAVAQFAATLYENREDFIDAVGRRSSESGSSPYKETIPTASRNLVAPYVVPLI